MVPSNAKVIPYITSIIGTWYGEQKLIQGINISGNNKVYTFTSQNATIDMVLVVERYNIVTGKQIGRAHV